MIHKKLYWPSNRLIHHHFGATTHTLSICYNTREIDRSTSRLRFEDAKTKIIALTRAFKCHNRS